MQYINLHAFPLTFKQLLHCVTTVCTRRSRNWRQVSRKEATTCFTSTSTAGRFPARCSVTNPKRWKGMARRDIGRVGRRVYNVPAAAIFRQVGTNGSTDFHIYSDTSRSTLLACGLHQTPTLIKLSRPGYRRSTPVSSKPWHHGRTVVIAWTSEGCHLLQTLKTLLGISVSYLIF
jgi:hypothetical protein